MRVFLAGATGVIGVRLVRLLGAAGHEVTGMTRSADKVGPLRELGADPVLCDVYDADALKRAVVSARPDCVMHQLTDLPDERDRIADYAARNNRIRTEGTANLIAAAAAAAAAAATPSCGRLLAQSIAWVPPAGGEGVTEHERLVLAAGGVVIRYGRFYGPGTYGGDTMPEPPRIHVDTAARETVALLDHPSGVVTVTEPAG